MANSELETLLRKLRELFVAEYVRGEKDAIARILQAAQGEPLTNGHNTTEPEASRGQKDRAPTGAAQAFVDRVLSEVGAKGASPSEIHISAKTEIEKIVSFSAIRFALVRGRDQGRYRNKRGKWFLKVGKETAELSANP